jgi:hypothetical protein
VEVLTTLNIVETTLNLERCSNNSKATVIEAENISHSFKGRALVSGKTTRDLYSVEIVNNLFFSEKSADSGRKLVRLFTVKKW